MIVVYSYTNWQWGLIEKNNAIHKIRELYKYNTSIHKCAIMLYMCKLLNTHVCGCINECAEMVNV